MYLKKHLPPGSLMILLDQGLLYNEENNLLLYHRTYNIMNLDTNVYITTQ